MSLARASCRLSFWPSALLLARRNQSPDAVRSRDPSKSTLAHGAVTAAMLHKHHLIIRIGAGLIQFVYRSHSHLATEFTRHRNAFSPFFARVSIFMCVCECVHIHIFIYTHIHIYLTASVSQASEREASLLPLWEESKTLGSISLGPRSSP